VIFLLRGEDITWAAVPFGKERLVLGWIFAGCGQALGGITGWGDRIELRLAFHHPFAGVDQAIFLVAAHSQATLHVLFERGPVRRMFILSSIKLLNLGRQITANGRRGSYARAGLSRFLLRLLVLL